MWKMATYFVAADVTLHLLELSSTRPPTLHGDPARIQDGRWLLLQ